MNTDDDQPTLADETAPVDRDQPPLAPKSTKPCRYCRHAIALDAKVCHLCRYHQKRYVQYFPYIQSVGLIFTIVALVLGYSQFREARQERVRAADAVRQVRTLALSLAKLTRQQLAARYVRGPDELEAAINRSIEQLLELAIPDATARQQWREQNFGTAHSQP